METHKSCAAPGNGQRRVCTFFFVLWYKLGRYTAFSPTLESPSTLRSQNKVEVLPGEIIGATWFVIKSWCSAREMYTRGPSADRHKNTESLYKATASSTRHFKAKSGHVSQLLLALSSSHISVSIHYLKLQWLSRTPFSPTLENQLNLIFTAKCTISNADSIQNQCQIKTFRWYHKGLEGTHAKRKWFLDSNYFF